MKRIAKTALIAVVALGVVGSAHAMEVFDVNMNGDKAKLKARQYHDQATGFLRQIAPLAHFEPFATEPFTRALAQAAHAPNDMNPAYNAAKGPIKAAITGWVGTLVPAGGHLLDAGVTLAPGHSAAIFGKAALDGPADRDTAAHISSAINAVIDQQDAASFNGGGFPLAHPANGKVGALTDSVTSIKTAVNAALDVYLDGLGVLGVANFLEGGVALASAAIPNAPAGDTLNDFKNAIHRVIADVVL
ncbi:MAG: hypothetical protein K0R52_939 [Alphaproteobacteria bacterium]|jgi:hypothetical protein|nr:hypothetical protein [Alphaproteobacteria bacterium]